MENGRLTAIIIILSLSLPLWKINNEIPNQMALLASLLNEKVTGSQKPISRKHYLKLKRLLLKADIDIEMYYDLLFGIPPLELAVNL